MEEDEIHQTQACKFPRVGNSRNDSNKYPNEELEDGRGELIRRRGCDDNSTNFNRFNNNWHHSSRIIRVSRASGGKDRHSKVMTSKGLRDRRVRLSVTTAIQFYDLQDRLGYDQPSKAVEWLIKSASDAISELPSLNNTFPDTPKQPSDEKRASLVRTEHGFDSADAEMENGTTTENGENNYQQNNNQSQNLSLSKSACSSTSETSKGSGLSLSRSDIRVNRVKARERARERTAKEKEKENESHNNIAHHQHNVNSISQTASFTELLTGGMNNTANSPRGGGGGDEVNLFHKATRQQWSSAAAAPMDYFSPVLLGPSSSSTSSRNHRHHQNSSGFSLSQIQLGHNSLPDNAMSSVSLSPFSTSDQLQQHYSFIPHDDDDHHHHQQHLMPAVVTSSQPTGNNNDYNLNSTISSGLAGYNRGTLQSNSPSSLLPHLQRFSSPSLDGSSTVPFFMGAAPASASAAPTMENNNNNNHQYQHHHQFSSVFDGSSRLHLCYGDGCRHSDQKGKSKN